MVKPRQRKYPTVTSTLNLFRESVLILVSLVFWVYCLTVIVVYLGTLFKSNIESVSLIRVVLNIESRELINLLTSMGFFTIFIFLLFIIRMIINKKADRYT